MKKLTMCVAGAMMVLSLAACTPTQTKTESQSNNTPVAEQPTGGASDKVPDPNAPALVPISLYYENEDSTGLLKVMDEVEGELSAQALIDKLIGVDVLEEGTQVISFTVEGEEAPEVGPGAESAAEGEGSERIGVLDLSQTPQWDVKYEQLMLDSVGNTFIENYNLDKLKLLVNGQNYSSENVTQSDDTYLLYVTVKSTGGASDGETKASE